MVIVATFSTILLQQFYICFSGIVERINIQRYVRRIFYKYYLYLYLLLTCIQNDVVRYR